MCGIFGFNFSDKKLAKSIVKILNHRGPDDNSIYEDELFTIGYTRLSIIDLDKGNQPIYNAKKTKLVFFNGEIYNYKELRTRLEKKGYKFKTNSDTEIVIHSYEEYGKKCLNYFNGMFALIIYDLEKKEIFIARDRLGIKPLYYSFDDNRFLFSSEMKAIFLFEDLKKELNHNSINNYFTFRYCPGESTFIKGIKKLLPAHYLVFKDNKLVTRKYWNLEFSEQSKSLAYFTNKFQKLFEDSVKKRMIADVPIGALLSGGIDSSSIVAMMSKNSDSNIKNINEIINFYANYTNITNDIPISGASCTIYFTDGTESMTFNSGLFKYNRSFSSIGIKNYNVTCDGSAQGFTALSTNEYASINFDNSPSGANITEISNERGTFALSTPSTILESGNLTFFNFDSNVLTNSWQAYYGNITGGIKLESASGAVFYQWEILDPSGEVYAARVSDINFATLNCTNSTQISTEESYIGHLSAAADSVTNTFDSATHPNFTIGEQFYDENLCFATNMYSNSVQSNNFFEVLLSDAANNIVYTTIIENNKLGFDNTPYHFQMLVGENGQDSIGTSYYFFVEVE